MYVEYREELTASSEKRWWRNLSGERLPWRVVNTLKRFTKRSKSGDGIYFVDGNFVTKMADSNNGVFSQQHVFYRQWAQRGNNARQNPRYNRSNW